MRLITLIYGGIFMTRFFFREGGICRAHNMISRAHDVIAHTHDIFFPTKMLRVLDIPLYSSTNRKSCYTCNVIETLHNTLDSESTC